MKCKKCHRETLSDSEVKFCSFCGASTTAKSARRTRANGTGSAYRRGKVWTSVYVYDWARDKRLTASGFVTKKEALDFVPVLKASLAIQPDDRRRELLAQCKLSGSVSNAIRLVESYGRSVPDADLTFKEVFDKWLPWYEPRIGESTRAGYVAALPHYKPLWGQRFADLSTEDLQECVDDCPRGRRTKENMKSLAMQMYAYAGSRRIMMHNYAKYVYCGKDDTQKRPGFTPDQLKMIRKVIGKIPYAEYVYCMCYLGHRPNEMLSREKTDHKGDHIIGGFKTEAGTDRAVTISPKIAGILGDLLKTPGPYLFPKDDGTRMSDEYFREKVFYPLLDTLGIQPMPTAEKPARYKPYSCRHTFSDLLKNVAGSDTDKAGLMGHADASMTKYYQSADLASKKAITDQI